VGQPVAPGDEPFDLEADGRRGCPRRTRR
jgi:hypothetical protein